MDSQYFNHITKLYLEKSKDHLDHLGQLEDRKNNECGQSLLGKMVKDNIDRLEKLRFRIKNSNPEVSKNLVFSKPSSKAKKISNRAFKQTSNKLTTSTGIVAVFCIIPTITFLTLTFSPGRIRIVDGRYRSQIAVFRKSFLGKILIPLYTGLNKPARTAKGQVMWFDAVQAYLNSLVSSR